MKYFLDAVILKNFKSYILDRKKPLTKILNFLIIIASLILVFIISLEAFRHDSFLAHSIYFDIQFWICIYFTLNFFIFLFLSDHKFKFLAKYSIIFFLCIPYLTILDYTSIQLTQQQIYLIGFIPLIRGGVALIVLLHLMMERNSTALFISYLLILSAIIYSLSLIFFIFEREVNYQVQTFGDALWWAGMTVTTVGSNIVPLTNVGKIVTTVLAATGMTTFPIFTVYFTTIVNRLSKTDKK